MKLKSLLTGEKTAGVVGELQLNFIRFESITFNPSNKYLTLNAIWNDSPWKETGNDSYPVPISCASVLILIKFDELSVVIFITLLCWSAKTAILSKEAINSFLSNSNTFSKVSGSNWE